MIRRRESRGTEETETRVISQKEAAKLLRKQAYQRMKERRAKDPKILAMKEAMKQRRRALYQREKERRKTKRVEQKAKDREGKASERARADFELMKIIKCATNGSTAEN